MCMVTYVPVFDSAEMHIIMLTQSAVLIRYDRMISEKIRNDITYTHHRLLLIKFYFLSKFYEISLIMCMCAQ